MQPQPNQDEQDDGLDDALPDGAPAPTPESLRANRFEVIRRLGGGSQGTTSLARDTHTGRTAVLRHLSLAQAEDWKSVDLIRREADVLARLDHPGVPAQIDAYTVDEEQGQAPGFVIVREFVEGETLQERIDRSEAFDERSARDFAHRALTVLAYLHAQQPPVIHRDIKPANVVIRPDGELTIIDLGAVQVGASRQTHVGSTIVGTSGYVPPEQLMGRATPSSDLYALGATIVHALSGVPPAELPVHRMRIQFDQVVSVSQPFRSFLARLLAPALEDRFVDAREALDALDALAPLHQASAAPAALHVVVPPAMPELRDIPAYQLARRNAFLPHALMLVSILVMAIVWFFSTR